MFEYETRYERQQREARLKAGIVMAMLALQDCRDNPTAEALEAAVIRHCGGDERLQTTTMCVLASVL